MSEFVKDNGSLHNAHPGVRREILELKALVERLQRDLRKQNARVEAVEEHCAALRHAFHSLSEVVIEELDTCRSETSKVAEIVAQHEHEMMVCQANIRTMEKDRDEISCRMAGKMELHHESIEGLKSSMETLQRDLQNVKKLEEKLYEADSRQHGMSLNLERLSSTNRQNGQMIEELRRFQTSVENRFASFTKANSDILVGLTKVQNKTQSTIANCEARVESGLREMVQQRAKDERQAQQTLQQIHEQIHVMEKLHSTAQQQHHQHNAKLRKSLDEGLSLATQTIKKLESKIQVFQTHFTTQIQSLRSALHENQTDLNLSLGAIDRVLANLSKAINLPYGKLI